MSEEYSLADVFRVIHKLFCYLPRPIQRKQQKFISLLPLDTSEAQLGVRTSRYIFSNNWGGKIKKKIKSKMTYLPFFCGYVTLITLFLSGQRGALDCRRSQVQAPVVAVSRLFALTVVDCLLCYLGYILCAQCLELPSRCHTNPQMYFISNVGRAWLISETVIIQTAIIQSYNQSCF
jgi:hypothetical protein